MNQLDQWVTVMEECYPSKVTVNTAAIPGTIIVYYSTLPIGKQLKFEVQHALYDYYGMPCISSSLWQLTCRKYSLVHNGLKFCNGLS